MDPDSPDRDNAEALFTECVGYNYERFVEQLRAEHIRNGGDSRLFMPAITLRDFKRELISKCKAYLKANR
jgi:hypothetical protein